MPSLRPTRVATEAVGVLVAVSWAVILLAHALAGPKRALLLDDGDTVLLPLMLRSFVEGRPIEWGMSPVLFVFPELPLYVLSAAVTTTVSAALLLNGVLNVAILYGLLRAIAGRVARARPIVAALAGVLLLTVLSLCESRPGGNTGEIASLYLTTTYYTGTVMALVAAIGLAVHLLAGRGDRAPSRIRLVAAALAALSALATFSNPLYLLWATGPIALAAATVALLRWRGTRPIAPGRALVPPALVVAALVVGSAAGWLGRSPLQRFIIADKSEYLRWGGQSATVAFFRDSVVWLVQTPGGLVEAVLGVLLTAAVGVLTVVRLVRGHRDPAAVAGLIALASVVVVPLGLFVTGTLSTRYAMSLLFTPLVALVALIAAAPERRIRRRPSSTAAIAVGAAVALVAATVVVAVPSAARVVATGRSLGDPAAACLTSWARGKDVAGVAQFWSGRGLQAYAGSGVDLLQVKADFSVYPWLVDLAAYRNARVGYVIVATAPAPGDHLEGWGDSVTQLGTPRDVVHCDGYDIVDFRGTPAAAWLTRRVAESARAQALLRGFSW